MDDSEIIALLFERSEQGIDALSEKYGAALRALARGVLRNPADAEECVSDVLLAVWDSIPPQRPRSLGAYAAAIARNLACKRYHANTARKRNSFYDSSLDELSECLAAPGTPEDVCEARELSAAINRFLAGLAREDRVMFVRRYWFADSVSDIAAMLHTSARRVSVRLFRTRESLRQYLIKEGLLP